MCCIHQVLITMDIYQIKLDNANMIILEPQYLKID